MKELLSMTVGEAYSKSLSSALAEEIWEFKNPGEPVDEKNREYISWRNSLPCFLECVHLADLDNLLVVFEMKTPISNKAIDVLLVGKSVNGENRILLVELKQWTGISTKYVNDDGKVYVSEVKAVRRHPLKQLQLYLNNLDYHHSGIQKARDSGTEIQVGMIAYLHNFINRETLYTDKYKRWEPLKQRIFAGGDDEKKRLVKILKCCFINSCETVLLEILKDYEAVLGDEGLEGLRKAYKNEASLKMKDDQQDIVDFVLEHLNEQKENLERHKQHYNGTEEKFNEADFDEVLIIFSVYFNRSALDDVESQLITYFTADNFKKTKQMVSFENDDVINRTGGNSVNEYVGRENVASDVILPVWENELYPRGWVTIPTIDELRTKELVKYSPIKILTAEQGQLITEIVNNPDQSYVINGDAGTGKTVLLTHLVASLLKDRPGARIGVVVQPNWEKTGADIFKVYGMDSSFLSITTSTKIIADNGKYDVIIVDESHKLSRKYGKQHPSFSNVYNISGFENCNSHLEILQKMGDQIILMYDVLQAIRPANVTRVMFKSLTAGYSRKFLKTQFRIQAPAGKNYTSDDYVNGIKYLLYKDTGLLDSDITNYDPDFNRDIFRDKTSDAYFGYVVGKPMSRLIDWVEEDRNFNPEHINRVLSGMFCCDTVDTWSQSHGKNPSITHFHEDGLDRRWNSTQKNWINIGDADAEDQIGSVFAVQGIDLNKVGVMIGPDIFVNDNGVLEADPDHHNNMNNKFSAEEMTDPKKRFEFTLFILNQYYVLLTRGIDGIRLGFWENDAFREYMEKTLEICF